MGKTAIKIETWNDRYGNPRRGWLVIAGEGCNAIPVGWIDEGYVGRSACPREIESCIPAIQVQPSEFKAIRQVGQYAEKAEGTVYP